MKNIYVSILLLVAVACAHRPPASSQFPLQPVVAGFPNLPLPDDHPDEAADAYLMKRSIDGATLPVNRYLRGVEHARAMPVYSTATRQFAAAPKNSANREISLGTWKQLGPGNIGGRTRSLIIDPTDPNIMYAGGVAGGVWKTTTGGASWLPVGDLLPNLAISALVMDPKDPRVIYAGTGEYYSGDALRGIGVFKTTDAAATWSLLSRTNTPAFYFVNRLVISPNNSQRVYAATVSGVWRSSDGGATWINVLDRSTPLNGCQDLVIRADRPADYLFASCGSLRSYPSGAFPDQNVDTGRTLPATVFRNIDAAGSGQWESVLNEPKMGRTSLAIAPSNQNVIYALASTNEGYPYEDPMLAVFRSTLGGGAGTWEARVRSTDADPLNTLLLSSPLHFFYENCFGQKLDSYSQGFYDNVIAVDPLDANRVWTGGVDLFRSDDGGATWGIASYGYFSGLHYSHPDHHALVFHPGFDGNSNQILFDTNDGGIFRTENARAVVARGFQAACNSSHTSILWNSVNNSYGVTQFYYGQPYPGGLIYMAGAQDNGTVRGTDSTGPGQWQPVFGGDGGYVIVDPTDANVIYLEATRLSLRKSVDGGKTFSGATQGITEDNDNFSFTVPVVMDPNRPEVLWLAGKSVWRTTDGAANWTQASPPVADGVIRGVTIMDPRRSNRISAIAVAPTNSNRVMAGASFGHIYVTNDAANADRNTPWSVTQPRAAYVSSLAFDPANSDIAYATYSTFLRDPGDHHIYRTTDGGVTWSGADGTGFTSVPDVPVNSIVVDPSNSFTLYVGTDLGVFVSLDGGGSWAKEDTGFLNVATDSLAVDRPSSSLFAFTHGRGAWRVRLASGGNPCSYSISPGSSFFDAVGGTGSVNVNTPSGCAWSALSVSDFLSITSKANGAGNATIRFAVPVNELPSNSLRTGALIVADQTHTVVQAIIPSIFGRDNDTMTSALTISNLPFAYALDTRSATADPNDPVHACTGLTDSRTVWLQFTPTFTGSVLARAKGYSYGVFANPGTVLSAYSGATELACDKSIGGPPSASQIRFDVTAGQIYFIEVSGNGRANPGGYIAFSLVKSSPTAEIAVASLDFGSVSVGQSADRKFTLKSTGNVPLTASLATGSPQFTIVAPAAGFTVASGDQQQITMRFTPADTGAQPSTLTLSSNDAAHPSISVALTGTGVVLSPAIDLAPLVLGFGTVNTGDTQDQPLVLTNTGKGALTIRSISTTDPQFTVSAPDVPFTLPPSAQQTLTIHFTPAASGTQTATLSISSDDPNHPVASVVLTGTGN